MCVSIPTSSLYHISCQLLLAVYIRQWRTMLLAVEPWRPRCPIVPITSVSTFPSAWAQKPNFASKATARAALSAAHVCKSLCAATHFVKIILHMTAQAHRLTGCAPCTWINSTCLGPSMPSPFHCPPLGKTFWNFSGCCTNTWTLSRTTPRPPERP